MNKKLLLTAIGVLVGLALVATATYAWFSASVEAGNVKDQVVTTGTLELTYTDGTEIKLENARPGATATKTITVKNTGTLETSYNLVWQVLKNEITNDEMVMSATCERLNPNGDKEENCEGLDETPITKNMILKGVDIPSGYSHVYEVTVTFKETKSDQNYNQGKSFTGVLGIDEYKEVTPIYCTYDGTLENNTSFQKGIYTYTYTLNGSYISYWSVILTNKDSTDPITEAPCTYINDEPITRMTGMFSESKATTIDVSKFNTKNVTLMNGMFLSTSATEIKGLDKLDTSNVKEMLYMFSGSQATSLDLSNFDTSNVYDMQWMFQSSSATTIDVSSFDTRKLGNMEYMFNGSKVTEIIGLENFNTSKVENMYGTFANLKIEELDLSSFDTNKVTNMSWMFINCPNLKRIFASDKFITTNVSNSENMFKNSPNLVGGNGTTYDESHTDGEYARIDTASTPGYFTRKAN